jgi:hypothetical protein
MATFRAKAAMDPSVGASREPALLPDAEQDTKIGALLVRERQRRGFRSPSSASM